MSVTPVLPGESMRDYLVRLGLAKPSRGRYGKDAIEAALAARKAFGENVFAEPVKAAPKAKVEKPAVVRQASGPKVTITRDAYDPKAVRQWAEAEGLVEKGKRGRLPSVVLAKYLATDAGQVAQRAKPVLALSTPKVRRETQGFVLEGNNLLAFYLCASKGGCGQAISRCTCPGGPRAPHYLPGDLSNAVLTLDKPVA